MRTRFAALVCLLSASTLALTGCIAGFDYDRGIHTGASFLYTMADNQATTTPTGITSSYPVAATGVSVAATSSASVPTNYLGYGVHGDGRGNLYALANLETSNGFIVNVYSTANGALTLSRSFTYTGTALAYTLAADPTGIVYVGVVNSGYGILKFAANATGAAAPTAISTTTFYSPMVTDSAGDLYGVNGLSGGVVSEFLAGFTTGTPSRNLNLSGISTVSDMVIDSNNNIYLTGYTTSTFTPFISEYSSATGTTAPTKTISGASTLLVNPVALAVDSAGVIYEEDAPTTASFTPHVNTIYTFSATATGNVAPVRQFSPATQTLAPATYVGLVAY